MSDFRKQGKTYYYYYYYYYYYVYCYIIDTACILLFVAHYIIQGRFCSVQFFWLDI